jgi:uncharacterized membrane protein
MPKVEQSIEIHAPISEVYNFIANQPERMVDWWPPIEVQERVTPAPTVLGSKSRYVYNMMGVKISGQHEVMALNTNQHLLVKTISGIDSSFDFTFQPSASGTKLTIRVDYTMPGSVLGQLLNKIAIEDKNKRDLEEGLQNLKRIIESEART